jgi:ketosteroid isomerase-like protein
MTDDADAILSLLATYAARLDAGDFAGLATLFEHAVVTSADSGMHVTGTAEVLDIFEQSTRRFANGTPCTKHVTTNAIVDVDGDRGVATARSYFTVVQQTDTLPMQPVIAGRYHDQFTRTDGTWAFSRREIIIELVGDLREHLYGAS